MPAVLRMTAVAICLMAAAVLAAAPLDADERKLWTNMCASCHDGQTAPDIGALRDKYETLGRFHKAVMNKGGRCMNILKNDEGLIRKIGIEIGLKE